ncbi:potassium transporter Kup [Sandaracinus amylolyticus]|uniref:Probable potassium transport system protein Kup n=1 Tax=Sandaracinus amylolyticus TaxID=927083 RepID=A0A0F6W3Q8_9BACT|nr:potassium transporter Kup [Sandaracinus amylolyticus]AKF06546.1 Kup system potassium uptake protein [Sandaracinus amylolyticus]
MSGATPGTESAGPPSGGASGTTTSETTRDPHVGHHHHGALGTLALGALGVVYGDIGTSPLYALRECFHESSGITPTHENVLGVLSLFVWAMTLVVVVKYIVFVTRVDNGGEGGILALLALVLPKRGGARVGALVLMGLFGASLLYADGMLTPAISVVSAVEGIEQIEGIGHALDRWIVPIAIAILVVLFLAQKRGTGGVGLIFGPVMLLWFVVIGALGAVQIAQHPEVLAAISPHHAVIFFARHQLVGFLVLGSVVLCITGGEALYADMGHFGRRPIVLAWFAVAFPGLILNYLGQGALLLAHPEHAHAPFFSMAAGWMRIPLVILATLATVIASQALISGAFSLTRQAIQLGYLPRLEIRHTSSMTEGQVYLPEVNRILMVACIALVIAFESSSRMAAAYGIAVTGTMGITTVLFYVVVRKWWGTARALAVCVPMLIVDLAFFGANVVKIASGGWVPIVVAFGVLAVMTSWKKGRERVARFLQNRSVPLDEFIPRIERESPFRVKGTAVFMTASANGTPPVLVHHYRHNQVLHEQIMLLSIQVQDVPFVPKDESVTVDDLGHGIYRVTAKYGFMQSPRVTEILRAAEKQHGLATRPEKTSFYLGREKLVVTKNPGMAQWRKVLFTFLSRNARPASDYFKLPPDRVLEIGMQLEL